MTATPWELEAILDMGDWQPRDDGKLIMFKDRDDGARLMYVWNGTDNEIYVDVLLPGCVDSVTIDAKLSDEAPQIVMDEMEWAFGPWGKV